MKNVVILSCGSVAADVAARLLDADPELQLTVADIRATRAMELATSLGMPSSSGVSFDAANRDSIRKVVAGADLVFNGVGPYYRFGSAIVEEVVAAGAHYVDICDEYDVTRKLVTNDELDREARAKNLTVLTGMGASPGLSNLLAKWGIDQLDEATSVDIVLGVPMIVDLGVTINAHMLHSLAGTVTQWLDKEYVEVPAWSGTKSIELIGQAGRHDFSYWGHPEAVTLPRYVPSLIESTSRFSWLNPAGNELYQTFDRWGLAAEDEVPGVGIRAREFLAAFMASEVGRTGMTPPKGDDPTYVNVWHIVATGTKDGRPTTITLEAELDLARRRKASGAASTAIPAVMGIQAVLDGTIDRRGVVAPEACIDPEPFIRQAYAALEVSITRRITQTDEII